MTSHLFSNVGRVGVATAVLVSLASMLTVDTVSAQQLPPAEQAIPPSTNPTKRVVYPEEGQTGEQQLSDQLECYRWSTQQTGWDPHQAEAVLRQQHGAAMAQVEGTQGGGVGGAARGCWSVSPSGRSPGMPAEGQRLGRPRGA